MQKEYQKLRKSIFRYVIWMILFWGIRMLLSFFQIEYRLWLSALGSVISVVVPFILFGQRLAIENDRAKKEVGKPSLFSLRFYTFLACIILFIAGIYGLFTMNEERITENGQLEVAYSSFLSESHWYPFEKILFWGRRPIYGLEEIAMLEEKYGCKFKIDRDHLDLEIHWIRFIPDPYPQLTVNAYIIDGLLWDDFKEEYIGSIFSRVYKELNIKSEKGYQSFTGGAYQTCLVSDWSNPSLLAKDAATLITYAIAEMDCDVNAPCNSGVLYVVVRYHDEIHHIPLPFGDSSVLMKENKTRDYYSDPEHVYEELTFRVN